MGVKFLLMVNKQGQTRLSQYYGEHMSIRDRAALENELIRKCLSRHENQCSFVEYKDYLVIYRRYASLYFIIGLPRMGGVTAGPAVEQYDENELAYLEFIHTLVETLDRYFENVCELDIMFNLEKAHFILEEMVCNGCIVDTNKANILGPLFQMEKLSAQQAGEGATTVTSALGNMWGGGGVGLGGR